MLSRDPTYLGDVAAVSGSSISVKLASSIASGLSIIRGRTYRVGQVGSFVRIPQGYQNLFGIVSEIGANAIPERVDVGEETGRWMRVELVGEVIGGTFDRGVSQYPNVGDFVHLAIEKDLQTIYGVGNEGQIAIGSLSSAESISARIALDELVTRHSAVLGSTGSGKSTTVASLLRAITNPPTGVRLPSARILILDLHGEYSEAMADVAEVYSVEAHPGRHRLFIPYWALETAELLSFLTGEMEGNREAAFTDKIYELKSSSHEASGFPGVDKASITVDTPLPFSLKRLWYDLLDFEIRTFSDSDRKKLAVVDRGDIDHLEAPIYEPHAMGAKGPFLNQQARGITRQLSLMRSRLLDRRYDFLLHPGPWEPDENGKTAADLDRLLEGWLGGNQPITILDLSGVPSAVLEQLIGSILRIVYEALFWSRSKTEGGVRRPLLVVMEEAHRYLAQANAGLAAGMARRIVKEGRKYGVGAMVISQRPSEVDETVLSQCGTFIALRLSNAEDRGRVRGTVPDSIAGMFNVLPILRTGEAIVTGEAARLPMRCRVSLPEEQYRPQSEDPKVAASWRLPRRAEGYERVVASWRAQSPFAVAQELDIALTKVEDEADQ